MGPLRSSRPRERPPLIIFINCHQGSNASWREGMVSTINGASRGGGSYSAGVLFFGFFFRGQYVLKKTAIFQPRQNHGEVGMAGHTGRGRRRRWRLRDVHANHHIAHCGQQPLQYALLHATRVQPHHQTAAACRWGGKAGIRPWEEQSAKWVMALVIWHCSSDNKKACNVGNYYLPPSNVAGHFDEKNWQEAGKRRWLPHTECTMKLSTPPIGGWVLGSVSTHVHTFTHVLTHAKCPSLILFFLVTVEKIKLVLD